MYVVQLMCYFQDESLFSYFTLRNTKSIVFISQRDFIQLAELEKGIQKITTTPCSQL